MSQGEPSKCFIGRRLNEQCHFGSSSSELTPTSDLSKEENRCIELRTGLASVSDPGSKDIYSIYDQETYQGHITQYVYNMYIGSSLLCHRNITPDK